MDDFIEQLFPAIVLNAPSCTPSLHNLVNILHGDGNISNPIEAYTGLEPQEIEALKIDK